MKMNKIRVAKATINGNESLILITVDPDGTSGSSGNTVDRRTLQDPSDHFRRTALQYTSIDAAADIDVCSDPGTVRTGSDLWLWVL